MRTNIVIDDALLKEAMTLGNLKTKKEAVEAGLRVFVKLKRQEQLRRLRGKLKWEGDLERMRID